jgi:hypothetical protein
MAAPIFIVGAPRSGTTLLRNMLNRHPALSICRETGYYHYVYSRRRSFGDLASVPKRECLIDAFLAVDRIRRTQLDLPLLRRHLLEEGSNYQEFYTSFLRFYAASQGKQRWGEKTPHPLFTETLYNWYPHARVLHLLRDPRDVVASLMGMPWAPDSVVANARWWLRDNLVAFRSHARPQYMQVRYEELAAHPEPQLRRICNFIQEDYHPAMLTPKPDPTADRAWFQRAEQPVTADRVGNWRTGLRPGDAGLIEWIAGPPHLETFGYQPAELQPSPAARLRALAEEAVDGLRRRAGEFPGGLYYLLRSTRLAEEEAAKNRYRFRNLPRTARS